MKDRGLIIFVKNPVSGKVKTRLAKDVGNEIALNVYLKLLAITKRWVLKTNSHKYLYFDSVIDKSDFWQTGRFVGKLQTGKDLGEKMENAFREILPLHKKVVIVGSDCPGMNEAICHQAFTSLESKDVVIGPAIDGGYYLLGMKKPAPDIFKNISWSTKLVLQQTILAVEKQNLTCSMLEKLPDIDTLENLERYAPELIPS